MAFWSCSGSILLVPLWSSCFFPLLTHTSPSHIFLPSSFSGQCAQIAYGAGPDNVHCVEPVEWGRRATLTMWFSLAAHACEDPTVLAALRDPGPGMPDTMWIGSDGQDVRLGRLAVHGFQAAPLPTAAEARTMSDAPSPGLVLQLRVADGGTREGYAAAAAASSVKVASLAEASLVGTESDCLCCRSPFIPPLECNRRPYVHSCCI